MRRYLLPLILSLIALSLYFFFYNVNHRVFVVEGQIIGFSDSDNRIFINHEEIPGYMDAMTMPFNLKNRDDASRFKIGDAIRFEFYVSPDSSWIQGIELIPDSLLSLVSVPSRFGQMHGMVAQEPIKAGDTMSNFNMMDQNGNLFDSESLRGSFTVLTFIYTSCPVPDFCPLMSSNLDAINRNLTEDERKNIKLLSISFDPENDTPDVLKAYEKKFLSTPNHLYLVGDIETTKRVTAEFGIFTTFATDQIIHNLQTAILDEQLKVVSLYSGNKWTVEELLVDLRKQVNPSND
jgi:protein SCO1/2